MTQLIYEHPLNEKLRTYLRLEHLLNQLLQLTALESEWQQHAFFNSLFDLIEVLDRNDIRPDLIKDCERNEAALVKWASHPSVADDKLQSLLQQTVRLQSELLRSNKFAAALKEDKFLAPLRQRFALPGGACYFDLPQLQFWFNLALDSRQHAVAQWCAEFSPLQQALQLVLQFCRAKGQFVVLSADNGFYQSNTEQHELLRIKYQPDLGMYPTVSGNKYRYAIRFMQLTDDSGRCSSDSTVNFELACC